MKNTQPVPQNALPAPYPQSPTAAAITPALPSPERPEMDEGGLSGQILQLLAAAATAEGPLTYPVYELLGQHVRKIFGEKALNAMLQARLHYALLHPAPRPEELIRALAAPERGVEQLPAEQQSAIVHALEALARHSEGHTARRLAEALRIALAESALDRRKMRWNDDAPSWDELSGPPQGNVLDLSWQMSRKAGLAVWDGTLAGVGAVGHVGGGILRGLGKILPGKAASAPAVPPPVPAVTRFNRQVRRRLDNLARMARTLEDAGLKEEIDDFNRILQDQPFRVVIAGEGKRGKSSLVNALLGENVSGVRESVPETAAPAEFYFSAEPVFQAQLLSPASFAKLEEYLVDEENLLLRGKLESLKAGANLPGGMPEPLTSREDLPDYLSTSGRYAAITERVSVGLPLPLLKAGMVLVDTPGLNSVDPFHDYLAWAESLTADCLIFVMDARRPDSASELKLLRKLALAGRAVSVIGVLTGVDRLNERESVRKAEERAALALAEGCRQAEGLHLLGLVSLDARAAAHAALSEGASQPAPQSKKGLMARLGFGREQAEEAPREGLPGLLELIRTAMAQDQGKGEYLARVAGRCRSLARDAREQGRTALARYKGSLPSPEFLELLERHTGQLAASAYSQADQAKSVIAAAAHDIDAWESAQMQALDQWEENTVLHLMEAARRRADALDRDFAKESAWKEFDAIEAPGIARRCLDEFLRQQREVQDQWQEKLRLFAEDMHALSARCLTLAEESSRVLGDICVTHGGMDHLLVQTNIHMGRLAVFLSGAGAGALLGSGMFNLLALGGAAVALLTNPLMLPGALLLGAAAYALHNLGDPARRKEAFLERKQTKMRKWAAETRARLEESLRADKAELAAAYKEAVTRGFVPALEILAAEAAHLRLYLEVMDRIRDDSAAYENSLNNELDALRALGEGKS